MQKNIVESYLSARREQWDSVAVSGERETSWGGYYRRWLARVYAFIIPPNRSVLEIGCAEGELLAAVSPSEGVGVDFSRSMIDRARTSFPNLEFIESDGHELSLGDRRFDYIILSDLLNDVRDVQQVLENLHRYCHPRTRLVMNSISHLWEFPVQVARRLGLATPVLGQNWLTVPDVRGLLRLANFEPVQQFDEIVWPMKMPLLAEFCNRILARIWPFTLFTFCHFIVARPLKNARANVPSVSVVVAARNEAGNIESILERVPNMGAGTELLFVEGGSKDDTYTVIESAISTSKLSCKLFRQPGSGKGDAVRMGFEHADGDILMILDADLSVAPEDLTRFYDAIVSSKGEFINGVRLVYPMEEKAMRFFNLLGNKFFSVAFSWLLGQPIKDTLCGTKVLWRTDYQDIAANHAYFGTFDPFGDFDLLFGAAKQNRKIIDLPVRYHARTYGDTNISRWRHGLLLLRMVGFAARKFKFV